MRHPRNKVILQIGGCVIDCSDVPSVVIMQDKYGHFFVVIGFMASDRTINIQVRDREDAYVVMSRIKRGMIAAACGEFGLLEDWQDEDGEDENGDSESGDPSAGGS